MRIVNETPNQPNLQNVVVMSAKFEKTSVGQSALNSMLKRRTIVPMNIRKSQDQIF